MSMQFEKLSTGAWIWIYQTAHGGFFRAPKGYGSKAAAQRAGRDWLTRRTNPRNRGR